jgi:hypothetical protein
MQEFKNLSIKVEGKKITIVIEDYTKEIGTSASGKSKTIATTSGNAQIEGTNGVVIGLNCYRKA